MFLIVRNMPSIHHYEYSFIPSFQKFSAVPWLFSYFMFDFLYILSYLNMYGPDWSSSLSKVQLVRPFMSLHSSFLVSDFTSKAGLPGAVYRSFWRVKWKAWTGAEITSLDKGAPKPLTRSTTESWKLRESNKSRARGYGVTDEYFNVAKAW